MREAVATEPYQSSTTDSPFGEVRARTRQIDFRRPDMNLRSVGQTAIHAMITFIPTNHDGGGVLPCKCFLNRKTCGAA